MLGSKPRDQSELLFAGSLRDFVPDEHVLARVDIACSDLSAGCVARCGSATPPTAPGGPASIPRSQCGSCWPAFCSASSTIASSCARPRSTSRSAGLRVSACLTCCRIILALTRIRQRWGADRFRAIFVRTVRACVAAGIAQGRGCAYRRHADPRRRVLGRASGEQARRMQYSTENGDSTRSARTDDEARRAPGDGSSGMASRAGATRRSA